MLLAWYDAKNEVGYPEDGECTDSKPGWFTYAASHGASLLVNINSGVFIFIFIFATGPEHQGG